MWAEAQVRGQGTMLANADPILQGRGHGSREASEKRRLRCQGHQPPARPGAVGQNAEGSPLWSPGGIC